MWRSNSSTNQTTQKSEVIILQCRVSIKKRKKKKTSTAAHRTHFFYKNQEKSHKKLYTTLHRSIHNSQEMKTQMSITDG